jgi:DedD protein
MATSTPDTSEIRRRGRQRLIGAVTIVLLLVVFVPMVLDSEPRQDRKEPALAIPPKDNAPPLPAPASIAPRPQLADATKSSVPPKPPEGPKVAAAPVNPPKADLGKLIEAKSADPPKVAEAAPRLEGFAVQVGAFREEEKLRQAREKLSAAKITHFIERLPEGDLTRLRAGPYKSREDADRALATIKGTGLDGKVVPLP